MATSSPRLINFDPEAQQVLCLGEWNLANISAIKTEIKNISWPKKMDITVNGQAMTRLDSAGAWLLSQLLATLQTQQCVIHLKDFSEQHQKLLTLITTQSSASVTNI